MKKKNFGLWFCQISLALLFATSSAAKFISYEQSVVLFTKLGMESTGRYIIATIEAVAALLLLTENFAAIGAVLSCSVMLGAAIAHLTKVGFSGPAEFVAWAFGFLGSNTILYFRRKTIPLLGETL